MTTNFQSVVFAGGGARCSWQIGFWEVVAPALKIQPRAVAAVSAGAAMASFIFSNRVQKALHSFSRRMHNNPKNFYPWRLFQPGKAAFPQAQIYREALLETFDSEAFANLTQQAPPIYMLLSHPPRWLGARSGVLVGFLAYKVEKKLHQPLHPTWGQKVGFQPQVVSSHDCNTPEELVDLILQSSCTPPFTPIFRRNGRVVLDGGLIDNVPVEALPQSKEREPTLVLLSRPYPQTNRLGHPHCTYVQPSQKATVSAWDYTSPDGILNTYEAGKKDGEDFLRKWKQT